MKFIVRIAILVALCLVGFTFYRLYEKGELNEDLNWDTFKEEGLAVTNQVKDNSLILKDRIESEIGDWDSLKGKLEEGLAWGEKELEAFKGSLGFLEETSAVVDLDKAKKDLEIEEVVVPEDLPDDVLEHEEPEPPVKKAPPVVVQKPAPVAKDSSSPYPNLEKSRSYVTGMKELEKAKEENRKGMPGKASSKRHLKKAVYLYKKSRKSLMRAQKDRSLNAAEKAHIEEMLTEISKQIYWGSKLGAM